MAKSVNATNTAVRAQYLQKIVDFLTNEGEDVGLTAANKINFPIVTPDGDEKWICLTVSVPMGADRGKEPYDGYGERETFQINQKSKAEKAAERKAKAKKAKEEREED